MVTTARRSERTNSVEEETKAFVQNGNPGARRVNEAFIKSVPDHSFWAMKVLSAECYGAGYDVFELQILKHLKTEGYNHADYEHMTMLEDSFKHKGPNGMHICLVFGVMAESLVTFTDWFEGGIPGPLVQSFTYQLLQAIDCAHACGVIHTDIKQSNIMVKLPDVSCIPKFLDDTASDIANLASQSEEYSIVPSRSLKDHYFEDGFNRMKLDVALADWGVASWTNKHLTDHNQPRLLRAPEVILHAPWDRKSICGTSSGEYSTKSHLEEMNALLGSFPSHLLANAKLPGAQEWFDENGNIAKLELKTAVFLEMRFSILPEQEAPKLVALTRSLLELDPKRRKSAKEILESAAWLCHDYRGNVDNDEST
ncbi:putative serine/threonine-protein kinase, active [Septoria linicola]|nr:putative serine/threonine-protein kinase, active [Septoria linicola]